MDDLIQDLRYGIRTLSRSKGYAGAASLTLALGIGANAAIFSVFNALMFRPLPVRDAHELVVVASVDQHAPDGFPHGLSYLDSLDYAAFDEVLQDLATYTPFIVSLSVDDVAERSFVELVSANYFEMLGVKPHLGRLIGRDEGPSGGAADRHAVIVLTESYWQRRFAADPDVVGRAVRINGNPYTVIGVVGESFPGTEFIHGNGRLRAASAGRRAVAVERDHAGESRGPLAEGDGATPTRRRRRHSAGPRFRSEPRSSPKPTPTPTKA